MAGCAASPPSFWLSQRELTDLVYTAIIPVWSESVPCRLSKLRGLFSAPHSGAWLTALPNSSCGTLFSPRHFQLLLKWRLGLPLMPLPLTRCAACGNPSDCFGDHALCCASLGIYTRHNLVRDCIADLALSCGLVARVEQRPESSPLRLADVLIDRFLDGHSAALDVSVVHPLHPTCNLAAV